MPNTFQLILFLTTIAYCLSYVVIMDPPTDEQETGALSDVLLRKKKSILVGLSETTEEVCKTRIRTNHRPQYGHIANGSRVEIQQDEENKLEVTFVECLGENRPTCHGVEHHKYASECVTVYEHRPAFVRIANSNSDYFPASIRVPILCECRLRRHILAFQKKR